MTQQGAMSDMYKQLEEVMKKCDNLSLQVKTIKKETKEKYEKQIEEVKKQTELTVSIKYEKIISSLNKRLNILEEDNIKLKRENIELRQENMKLSNEVDRLRKQINNNSDNSSNPPSTDIKRNIPNNRIKTGKNVGGQKGHKGYFISKKEVEEKIRSKEFEHEIINVGNISDKYISKYKLDIKVSIVAKEYRFYIDEKGKYNVPKEFKQDIQYGNEIKTLCSVLSTEGIVAVDRLTKFVSSITHGKIKMSTATILNFITKLSLKSGYILERIENKILNAEIMYTDATTARCDKKNISVRNYSTKEYTLLKATLGKSKKYIEETNILPRYVGNLVHDHETVIYNYGKSHGECNVHITRYLKGCYENTNNNWCKSMMSLLNSLNKYKKKLVNQSVKGISKEKKEKYTKRYEEILEMGIEENKKVKSKYYKKEEKKLLNRLEKYKENHLLFMYEFTIPYDNNISERDLRHVKTKQKVSGYFRSMEGIQNYLNIKSIISTCKKQGIDFYQTIFNIFENTIVTI